MGDAQAIVEAAHDGDLEAVRRLVQQDRGLLDANHGWLEYDRYTPLTAAAWRGHVEVIGYVLGEGAQVDLQDEADFSALGCACEKGHTEAIHLLLAHGADPAMASKGGKTPLMTASEKGHTHVVALLLARGCGDVDRQQSPNGWRALHYACSGGHAGVAMALLGAGADPHVVYNGETPLAMAVRNGREECVAILQVRCC
jgi:ankyrin repeat protein